MGTAHSSSAKVSNNSIISGAIVEPKKKILNVRTFTIEVKDFGTANGIFDNAVMNDINTKLFGIDLRNPEYIHCLEMAEKDDKKCKNKHSTIDFKYKCLVQDKEYQNLPPWDYYTKPIIYHKNKLFYFACGDRQNELWYFDLARNKNYWQGPVAMHGTIPCVRGGCGFIKFTYSVNCVDYAIIVGGNMTGTTDPLSGGERQLSDLYLLNLETFECKKIFQSLNKICKGYIDDCQIVNLSLNENKNTTILLVSSYINMDSLAWYYIDIKAIIDCSVNSKVNGNSRSISQVNHGIDFTKLKGVENFAKIISHYDETNTKGMITFQQDSLLRVGCSIYSFKQGNNDNDNDDNNINTSSYSMFCDLIRYKKDAKLQLPAEAHNNYKVSNWITNRSKNKIWSDEHTIYNGHWMNNHIVWISHEYDQLGGRLASSFFHIYCLKLKKQLTWNIQRLIWIGYYKSSTNKDDKNKCLFYQLSKDIVCKIIALFECCVFDTNY